MKLELRRLRRFAPRRVAVRNRHHTLVG